MGWFEAASVARNFDLSLLAPLFSGTEPAFPAALLDRLKTFRILEEVDNPALRRLLSAADWFGLPGGTQLARDGENDRAVFLVVTGSLGVFVESESGPKRSGRHDPRRRNGGRDVAAHRRIAFGDVGGACATPSCCASGRKPSTCC